jgi:cysteine desulfurase/selenocysteine lyase
MLGPTGIGFLWARSDVLAAMPPWEGGGEMIDTVGLHSSTFAPPPARFEAGTPNIAGAVGLAAAIDYLTALPGGMEGVRAHAAELGGYLAQELARLPGVRLLGPPAGRERAPLAAFTLQGVHPGDLAELLDARAGIAIRAGHHCTQPLHAALGLPSSARASCHVYSRREDVDALVAGVRDVTAFLRDCGV